MSLEELPEEMKEYISKSVSRSFPLEDYPVSVYLTEITGCIVRSFHERAPGGWEENFVRDFHLWKGTVLDKELTGVMPLSQKRVTHRIPGFDGTIVGKWDFLMEEGGKKIVCDLKVKDDIDKVRQYGPSEQYKRQVKFYMYCEGVGFGRLYYLSLGDCEVIDIIPPGDKLAGVISDLEERARLLIIARREGKPPDWKPPEGERKYMCGEWCNHYSGCYGDGEVEKVESSEKVIPVTPEPKVKVEDREPGVVVDGQDKSFQF